MAALPLRATCLCMRFRSELLACTCRRYTIAEYRRLWTKSDPEVVAAGKLDTTEHRVAFKEPDLKMIDATYKMAGHVGSWH